MKLRRGGPFAKEQPFAGFTLESGCSDAGYGGDNDSMDWADIDRILFRMSRSAVEEAQQGSFNLFIPEFGLIYGYDDEKQLFHAKDVSKEATLSYTDFVENRNMLWVTTITESLPHSKYETLRMALDEVGGSFG